MRGDLIEVFKIITNKDSNGNCTFILHCGFGNKGEQIQHVNYDLRKYFSADRIITKWSSLPDNVVSSTSINMFKNRLDNCVHAQDVYFNWKADLTGTGDRSESHYNTDIGYLQMSRDIMMRIQRPYACVQYLVDLILI